MADQGFRITTGDSKLNPNEKNLVLFSWPSDGSMMPYIAQGNDRRDATASGPAFARGPLKLAEFLCGSTPEDACDHQLHLVAHSMGNCVLRHAVQEYVKQSSGRPVRLFDQVFLIAADEDDDAFELDYKLKPLSRLAKRVNVYFNNNDRAMAVSDKSKGNPDRLGDDGPRVPRRIPGKVSLMDVHSGRVRTGAALLLSGFPEVVGAIEPSLCLAKIARSTRKSPSDIGAYDLYLQALPHLYAIRPVYA